MFTERDSPRLDGKRLFLTDHEELVGLVDLALVYLYGRSPATPLDRLTPEDLARDGMGLDSFARTIDMAGLQSYRTATRPTTWADVFDTLESIRVLYDRGVEVKEKAFVEHLCDDVPALLEGMDGRLDEFVAFARQVRELAETWQKGRPQAQAFFAGIKPALDNLDAACKKRDKLPAAADAARSALAIKKLTPQEMKDQKDQSRKTREFSELCSKVHQAAQARADLIRALRSAAKQLRDRAGIACAEHVELRGPAAELRQLAQGVLRNRYYFEGDWRGEPHRVAPYWLGPRPY
jgi:hypothetical protein